MEMPPESPPESAAEKEWLKILPIDHPFVNRKPKDIPLENEDDKIAARALTERLTEHMFHYGGIGLSSNQLGIDARGFVFGNKETTHAVLNPVIIGVSPEKTVMEESCLSFPGLVLALSRPASVTASYQTPEGDVRVSTFNGIGARVFLHEYDHMEGITILHHASRFKLKRAIDKLKKQSVKSFSKNLQQAMRQRERENRESVNATGE